MTGCPTVVERGARIGVDLIVWVARQRILVSCIGLAILLVMTSGYISVGVLGVNPARTTMSIRVQLPESGGLLANQDVTVRGIPVGRISAIELGDDGVEAVLAIPDTARIPRNSPVKVSGLSAAGEQYLDFRPANTDGPYLTDGAVIGGEQATIPVSLPQIIDDSRGALAQLDAGKLSSLFGELRVSRDGPRKLAAIFDGTSFLASTLYGVLPETVSLLRNTQSVFTTLADVSGGVGRTSIALQNVLGGVNAMDAGFRALADRGSGQPGAVDAFLADNRENIVQLLGNLTTVSQLLYLRVPALEHLWRPDHDSLIDRISTIFHDGGIWGIADLYPRYRCDYNLPRHAPSQADFPEPYLYT
ncbi:MAG TPA: MlaD family protein, partial [Mycobacterium sp.]|nr:MlaD family protein [Mycobacterium sp.]